PESAPENTWPGACVTWPRVRVQPMNGVTAIILAAGGGKRMRSRRAKVLHPLCGRPLIGYALRAARAVADRLVMVVSPNADDVVAVAGGGGTAVRQRGR